MGEMTTFRKPSAITVANEAMVDLESVDHTMRIARHHDVELSLDPWSEHHRASLGKAITAARAWMTSLEYQEALREVRAAHEPAKEKAVRTEVSMLVSAFPNAAKADLRAFGALLVQDVRSRNPSRYALAKAATKLRQTCRFVPTICEVLEALYEAEKEMHYARRRLEEMPQSVEGTAKHLAETIEATRPRTPEEIAEALAYRTEARRKLEAQKAARLKAREDEFFKSVEAGDWSDDIAQVQAAKDADAEPGG
jgi:ribosomal protein L9